MTTTFSTATLAAGDIRPLELTTPGASANDMVELSSDEIDGVAGGVLDPLSIVLGGVAVVVGYAVGKWLLS